jgi:PrcB C-terminal
MIAAAALAAILMAAPAAEVPRTLDKGDQSNVDDSRQVTVRTAADWAKLWQQHSPDRKRPDVDFSKDIVVGVFMGSRPTAGYTISILSTMEKDGQMLVQYQETMPTKGAMTAQILTSPFHLVAVPKVTGEVRFEKTP